MKPGPVLPSVPVLGQFFRSLLGRDVAVSAAKPDAAPLPIIAVYTNPDNTLGALWALDYALANHAGAALSMVPAPVAAKFAAARTLPDTIAENLAEVANVGASLLNAPGGAHLRFRAVLLTMAALPPSVTAMLRSPLRRTEATVMIAGYGGGRLQVMVTP